MNSYFENTQFHLTSDDGFKFVVTNDRLHARQTFFKGQCQRTQIYKQHYSSKNMNNRDLYKGQKIDAQDFQQPHTHELF